MSLAGSLSIPRGCLITCLSAFHKICSASLSVHMDYMGAIRRKAENESEMIGHRCWRKRRTTLRGQMTGLAGGHQS
ncbi:hypothetical protein VZT92_001443 [Zoarces viviparus]|uniref:Secreted protein n=1 Tax=Zoarces viviparus TaxID=48416 RepID=A0AAW1G4X4_ZOAVI